MSSRNYGTKGMNEIARMVQAAGCEVVRQGNQHLRFVHPPTGAALTVASSPRSAGTASCKARSWLRKLAATERRRRAAASPTADSDQRVRRARH